MKTIIVAYDEQFGIGANNNLLWSLPADLKHFKNVTDGQAIIMGSNTYYSIGRPLLNRQNIVISRENKIINGVTVVNSLQAAYDIVESGRETFVIGGGQIYALAFDTVDRILATELHYTFKDATIFFPKVLRNIWRETNRIKNIADERNPYSYDFVTYQRI